MALMKFREDNQVRWVGTRPGHNGEQVFESGQANNNTVILYTVPAGNTLYLCLVNYSVYFGIANTSKLMYYDGTPALWRTPIQMSGPVADNFGQVFHYWPPLELPEGYSIRLFSGGVGLLVTGSVFGWIE